MDTVRNALEDEENEATEGSELTRRRFVAGVAAVGVATTAGCSQSTESQQTTTETRTTTTTSTTHHTDETTTTTEEKFGIEEAKQKRANLTEKQKRVWYESTLPMEQDYELDFDRVRRENDSRREQLIDITATVGDQYGGYVVTGTHAVADAISNLDWMDWDQDNIINIVTRYNSRPFQEITVNYSTEDGQGRNLDGTIARDDGSGPQTYVQDIPNSELMAGNGVNVLVPDTEAWKESLEKVDWDEQDYRSFRLNMQSVIPGVRGPDIHTEPEYLSNRGVIFDDDAINYIGGAYDESAEAVNELSEEALEVQMAGMPIINSGRSIGVTAGEDGLEIDAVYSQEEAEKKLREPVNL